MIVSVFCAMSRFFPPAHEANDDGLIGIGGELTPDWLLDAYSHGIFPWPFASSFRRRRFLLGWFSLDPRCIFEFDQFHVPRRLERTIKNGRFRVTSDTDFVQVIKGCAERAGQNTAWHKMWITPEMLDAYVEFHKQGYAHSIEVWTHHDQPGEGAGELAGGLYGVAIGGLFAAESMFYRQRDASKVALVALIRHLKKQGYQLVDIQMLTEHTARFGAVEISRAQYLRRLKIALQHKIEFGNIEDT